WAKPSNRTALLSAWLMPFSRSLNVQFWIMPEDVVLVERDAPLRFEVRGDARPCRDPLVQRDRPRIFRRPPLHRAGKSIAQAGDHLEERQVRIGKRLAEKPSAFFARQHALEVAEEFRQALGGEVRGAALRFGLLVLVVEGAPDRVMRIVHFDQPVGDGELELVRPETRRLALRREAVARGEPQEDVRRLCDHQVPRFQKRRSERQASFGFAFQEARQRRDAALRRSRDIDVAGARFLQREPHEFPAALYRGPVIEFVAHGVLHGLKDSRWMARLRAGAGRRGQAPTGTRAKQEKERDPGRHQAPGNAVDERRAQASFDTLKESGDFEAQTNTRSDATGEVLRLIVDEFWRLQRERVNEVELMDAKAYLAGSFTSLT